MKTVKFEYSDEEWVEVRISLDDASILFNSFPYESTDAEAARRMLRFLQDNNVLSVSFTDKKSLEWFEKELY
jgi:hypothetical protein